MPVELVDFRANLVQKNVHLSWLTASETNNSHFSIEKSTDGQTFREIGKVAGQGTSYEVHNYQYTDEAPAPGINYYRLRQVDFDGQFSYSPVVSVHFDGGKGSVRVFPSIVQETATILFPEETGEAGMVFLFDQTGRLVSAMEVQPGTLEAKLPTDGLPAGMYFLTVQNGTNRSNHHLVKQ
ncbi:MAG: T9SS type A sorting domain-containing protein [Bacteroidetes bacterium]|nr:T9SS type A sorting domain-containing protein [Bacteroidota bacterium]